MWLEIEELSLDNNTVSFYLVDGSHFVGVVTDSEMQGRMFSAIGDTLSWRAIRIQLGTSQWPVLPRVRVRQLLVGSTAESSLFEADWLNSARALGSDESENEAMWSRAGLDWSSATALDGQVGSFLLGLDHANRHVLVDLMNDIMDSPASNREFLGLFRTHSGEWRLDIHDFAWQSARSLVGDSAMQVANLPQVLSLLGMQAKTDNPEDLRRAVWRFWQRANSSRQGVDRLTETGTSPVAASARVLGALLSGYDAAETWWMASLSWLLENEWMQVGEEWVSPVELVNRYWGVQSHPVPRLEIRHFGSAQAVPVIGAGALGETLVQGANQIADEFIASKEGMAVVLDNWRNLEFTETTPLAIEFEGRNAFVGSPASVARSRLGGFIAASDAIQIESSIVPLLAVATVVHEWQHLLVEKGRMTGNDAFGIRDEEWGLQLVDGDPWLAEGAAEWFSEQILSSSRIGGQLFRAVEAGKRREIAQHAPDNTHVLGYLLVRSAAESLGDPLRFRQFLVASLHSPEQVARVSGFRSGEKVSLARPSTLVLIPEVVFSLDSGVADGATRRLITPKHVLEN